MDIVACFDHCFVMPTGVMIYSVCANNVESEIVFHLVIDESVTEKDKKDLTDTVSAYKGKSVVFYPISSDEFINLPALKGQNHLNHATYYRLALSDILPSTLQKVLYLDGDIIVVHSLQSLWETDLTGYALAAVPAGSCSTEITIYNRLGYSLEFGYFNAGVLLINLEYWHKKQISKVFREFISTRYGDIRAHDQDVLNAVFFDKKLSLPIKYNLTMPYLSRWPMFDKARYGKELEEALTNPVIIHFTPNHPWCFNRYTFPLESIFHEYKSKTIWSHVPIKDKRPLMLRLRHHIADTMRRMGLCSPLPKIYIDLP